MWHANSNFNKKVQTNSNLKKKKNWISNSHAWVSFLYSSMVISKDLINFFFQIPSPLHNHICSLVFEWLCVRVGCARGRDGEEGGLCEREGRWMVVKGVRDLKFFFLIRSLEITMEECRKETHVSGTWVWYS